MSTRSQARIKAAAAALAPAGLFGALLAHPHLPGRLPDHEVIAAAVTAQPTLWGLAHLAAGVASGLMVIAFLAVHSHLRATRKDRWSGPALSFVIVGSTLYAMLPGMEFAPLAAVRSGADAAAAQAALAPWFLPVLFTAATAFAIGAVGFAADIVRNRVLEPRLAWVVAAALVVMATSRFIPFAVVQFHVQGIAALVAFWPLSHTMWNPEPAERPEERIQSVAAV